MKKLHHLLIVFLVLSGIQSFAIDWSPDTQTLEVLQANERCKLYQFQEGKLQSGYPPATYIYVVLRDETGGVLLVQAHYIYQSGRTKKFSIYPTAMTPYALDDAGKAGMFILDEVIYVGRFRSDSLLNAKGSWLESVADGTQNNTYWYDCNYTLRPSKPVLKALENELIPNVDFMSQATDIVTAYLSKRNIDPE